MIIWSHLETSSNKCVRSQVVPCAITMPPLLGIASFSSPLAIQFYLLGEQVLGLKTDLDLMHQ